MSSAACFMFSWRADFLLRHVAVACVCLHAGQTQNQSRKKTERRAPKHLTEVHCSQQAENPKNETNVGQHSWTWHQCCATWGGPQCCATLGKKKDIAVLLNNIGRVASNVAQHWRGCPQCCATLGRIFEIVDFSELIQNSDQKKKNAQHLYS